MNMALAVMILGAGCAQAVSTTSGVTGANPAFETGSTPVAAPTGAEDSIFAWAADRSYPRGQGVFGPVELFFGDYTGDGAPDALAFVYYPSGGNSHMLDVALFKNVGGEMRFLRIEENVYGQKPRDVLFTPGRITLTTTMPKAGDARCCPTGAQQWAILTE